MLFLLFSFTSGRPYPLYQQAVLSCRPTGSDSHGRRPVCSRSSPSSVPRSRDKSSMIVPPWASKTQECNAPPSDPLPPSPRYILVSLSGITESAMSYPDFTLPLSVFCATSLHIAFISSVIWYFVIFLFIFRQRMPHPSLYPRLHLDLCSHLPGQPVCPPLAIHARYAVSSFNSS